MGELAAPLPSVPARSQTARQSARRCPECLTPLEGDRPSSAIFCGPAHRELWRNRWMARGRVYAVMAAAARMTRDGTRGDTETGKWSASQANLLVTDWTEQDRAAGRMTAIEYMAIARRAGVKGFR